MPRVIITQYRYAHTNETALDIARRERMMGKRTEIITDEDYDSRSDFHLPMQDLQAWAKENNVDFPDSSSARLDKYNYS